MEQVKSPDKIEIFETTLLRCWFGNDGILYSESNVADRTIENYKQLFVLYKKISNDGTEKIRTLGNITETQPLSKAVREYISKELPKYIKAMALISDSSMGTIIGNFFIKLSKPPYPTQIFSNKEKAVKWLKQY